MTLGGASDELIGFGKYALVLPGEAIVSKPSQKNTAPAKTPILRIQNLLPTCHSTATLMFF
jgi:hypothetical protein